MAIKKKAKGKKKIIRKGNMNVRSAYDGSLMIKRTVKAYDSDTTGEQGFAFQFNLSAVPNVSEFINLFDRYKIMGVKLRVMFLQNSQDVGTLTSLSIPIIHYVYDSDDANPPTTEAELLQKNFLKTRRLDKPFNYYLKPKAVSEVYASASSTGYAVNKAMWIDMNSPNIPHYGFKAWISNGVSAPLTTVLGRFRIYATYYIALRDPQ